MRRTGSIVAFNNEEEPRMWLTPEDEVAFPAELCPTIVKVAEGGDNAVSFGFFQHRVQYEMLFYCELDGGVESGAAVCSDKYNQVVESGLLEKNGKVYLRVKVKFNGEGEGVHDLKINLTTNKGDHTISAHMQILHDHQGNAAAHSGVRALTSLTDAASEIGSDWPGHGN